MSITPCKGCVPPERSSACHSVCEKYINWKKEYEAGKAELKKRKELDKIHHDYLHQLNKKLVKKR